MKKRILPILVLLLCLIFASPVAAADAARLVDEADILSDEEERSLTKTLDEISERLQFDVAIVTKASINGADAENMAYEIYKENGYGFGSDKDGALLLVSMEEREWAITAVGYGKTALNADAKEFISQTVGDKLGDGKYAEAFSAFAEGCDDVVTQAKSGKTYREPFPIWKNLAIAFGISLVIGLIAVFSMSAELRSVKKQVAASAYVKKNSLKVTTSSERFLYHKVDKTEKVQNKEGNSNNVTHTGSSGKF